MPDPTVSDTVRAPILVVIVGPIASGKSTIAGALGERFRAAGHPVAVLDLDDFVLTIGGFEGLTWEAFLEAQLVFGELVGAWLGHGWDVIAHGPFFQREEDQALLHAVPHGIEPRRVHLHATFEVARQRVADDPNRGDSKDETFLRHTYERVDSLLPTMPTSEWTFDTTTTAWPDIVERVADALLAGESSVA